MNQVYVYKYVKTNPLIKLNVNDKVYVVNGFTNGGTIEAFKYVPWKSSELVQYNKKEMKELVKDL